MSQTIQIQADWAQTDSTQIDFIKNKPNLYEEWWGTQAKYDAILVKDPDIIYNIKYEAPEYFYVEDISGSDNTLSIVGNTANVPATEIFKSTDGENWTSMGTTSDTAITATIPANKKLYLKATTNALSTDWNNYVHTSTTGNYNIGGCIASLIFSDNFESGTITVGTNNFAFGFLFYNDTHLIDASNLTLPSSTATRCYQSMFSGCTNLVTPPSVMYGERAYTNQCEKMFYNCASMTTTPQLQATTLASSCYGGMFQGCTGLTTAPVLPATTLVQNCYQRMFKGCTGLTTAPELPATNLATYCYQGMFNGCTSLTTAPELPATTLAYGCYQAMFYDCTSLTEAPVLSATTSQPYCCENMFTNCSNLRKVVTYFTDIDESRTAGWLEYVAQTGDFYNLGGATYSSGTNGIPTGWTEHNSL